MSCFVTLPVLLDFQGQAELFNLASALLTMQDNLLVCFLCRCQKDLRMFSLAEQRAPFGFQAVLLQLGGEQKIGSLLSNAAAPGRPPPSFKTHQLHNLMGSMYLSFAKGLLNWLGHFPTPSMPTNHKPALLRCSVEDWCLQIMPCLVKAPAKCGGMALHFAKPHCASHLRDGTAWLT